jgi:four helix bundle protein
MVFEVSEKDRFAKNFRLRDQIQGAAISTMVNIAEGFDCDTDPDAIRFLSYAFRSATEVQSHLYVAINSTYTDYPGPTKHAKYTKKLFASFRVFRGQ